MKFQNLSPVDVKKKLELKQPVQILDVRTAPEYQLRHIPEAIWIPLHELPGRYQELNPDLEIVVVCEHGSRSWNACKFLTQVGFQNVVNMVGGMSRW